MDAAPTPSPATKRPAYMAPMLPVPAEPVCNTTPTIVMRPVPISAHRRPYLSVSQGVTKHAAKQPAWRVEATEKKGQYCPVHKSWNATPRNLTVLGHVGLGLFVIVCVLVLPVVYQLQFFFFSAKCIRIHSLLHRGHGQNATDGSDAAHVCQSQAVPWIVCLESLTPSRRACHRSCGF